MSAVSAAAAPVARRREWQACLAIAAHALAQYRVQGGLWLTWVLLAAFVPFAALAWWQYLDGDDRKLAGLLLFCAAITLGSLLLIWSTRLYQSLCEQATPASLRLVPCMRRRVGKVLGILVVAAGALAALVIGVPFGHPGQVFVVTCLALVEVPLMYGWRGYVLFGALFVLTGDVIPVSADFLLGEEGLALATGLLAVEFPNALQHVAGAGGRLPLRTRTPAAAAHILVPGAQAAALGRYASLDDLLAGILGPMIDGRSFARLAIAVLLLAAASRLEPLSKFVSAQAIHANVLIVLPIVLAGLSYSVVTKIYANSRELALFRLSPLAPPVPVLNRMLASWLVRRYVVQWFLYTALAMAVLLLSGAGPQLTSQAMAITGFTVSCAGYMLRDYSRPRRASLLMTIFGIALVLAGCAYLFLALGGQLTGTMHVVAEIAFAGGGLFTWYRWREMVGSRPAFPPGRSD